MREGEISFLLALTGGDARLTNLAKSLQLSVSYASRIVSNLEARGFVRREGRIIQFSRNSKSELLKQLSNRFDLHRLLAGRNEEILIALLPSSTVPELLNSTRLSYETLRRALNNLEAIGAVSKSDNVYSIVDPQVRFLIEMLQLDNLSLRVETYSQILWSKGELIIKRVPKGRKATGTLTAFSRFSEYGVEVRTPYDYYISSETSVGPEEVLMHALRVTKENNEMVLCGIFYVKLKGNLSEEKLARLSRLLAIETRWAALLEYLKTGNTPLERRLFPPWKEFALKARDYGVDADEGSAKEDTRELFKQIGSSLLKKIELYLLGGENLRLKGLKISTKDVDLVVESRGDYRAFLRELQKLGYEPVPKGFRFTGKGGRPKSVRLQKEGFPGMDIYWKQIAGKLILLPSIREKTEGLKFGNLTLHLLSNESVFLLKAVTGRREDLADMYQLSKPRDFNWKKVLEILLDEESATQKHYCVSLLDVLDIFQKERRIRPPIYQRLLNHTLDYLIPEVIIRGSHSLKDIAEKLDSDVPIYQVRNRLEMFVRKGTIERRRTRGQIIYSLTSASQIHN